MSKRRGSFLELECKRILEEQGYLVVKAGGSLGSTDLLASKRHLSFRNGPCVRLTGEPLAEVLLVQVKGTAKGPFHSFGPAERAELLADAERAGGVAVLAWRAPRKKWEWLYPDSWPEARKRAA